MELTRLAMLVAVAGCAGLRPAMPAPSPERPGLLSNGPVADPGRQAPLPGSPCVVECGPGTACDERSGTCTPVPLGPVDGGVHWVPGAGPERQVR